MFLDSLLHLAIDDVGCSLPVLAWDFVEVFLIVGSKLVEDVRHQHTDRLWLLCHYHTVRLVLLLFTALVRVFLILHITIVHIFWSSKYYLIIILF